MSSEIPLLYAQGQDMHPTALQRQDAALPLSVLILRSPQVHLRLGHPKEDCQLLQYKYHILSHMPKTS